MTPTEGTKSTRSKGRDTDSSHSLFTDLLRRAASPELLAGVAGAAAAAHFTKHAVDRSNDDEPEASAEPEDVATDESEDEEEDVPESESGEAAEDEQTEEPEDEQPDEPEDEATEEEETEEPGDESAEVAEDEVAEDEEVEEPEDEEADEPEAATESGEDSADTEADDEASDESQSSNGSLRDDDERMQLLKRAREYAEEFTGHPVESFSGFASEKQGWRVGLEVVEVERIPSTTDVLASYEVVLNGDGDLVDFRRAGRYYRNETGNSG